MPASRVCNVKGCGELTDKGRCVEHRRAADKQRGTSRDRGYNTPGHVRRFRPGVLARHPICVICMKAKATVADHWPLTRRELVRQGMDPNDPQHGRGLCKPCHDRVTAEANPDRWNT